MGYDDAFSKDEIDELKKFIDDSGALGLERNPAFELKGIFKNPLNSKKLSVDDFIDQFANKKILSFIAFGGSKTAELLDSDMSVDEFKEEWAKYALKERFNITLSGEDAKNAVNILKEMNEKGIQDIESVEEEKDDTKEKKFTPIQAESKNTETYDITKDEKFSFLLKLQELERERGIDVLRIMQKLEENGKKVVDKKV